MYCYQETYVWKYGMADHVARRYKDNARVEEHTELAKKFKQDYTVSEREKERVLDKFRGGRSRAGRNKGDHTLYKYR